MKDIAKLKEVCDAIVNDPALRPVRDASGNVVKTFCNVGAQRVAHVEGCREFDKDDGSPIMADEMHALMIANKSGLWLKVSGAGAVLHVLGHPGNQWGDCLENCEGGLAFASATGAMLEELHGHIAAIYPDTVARGGEKSDGPVGMGWSGSLQKNVPKVANVGKHDEEENESAAFPPSKGEADYFIWQG